MGKPLTLYMSGAFPLCSIFQFSGVLNINLILGKHYFKLFLFF